MEAKPEGISTMAVPWIKIETTLLHKPEVMRLAALLDCDEYKVTGHLVAFWSWVDANLSRNCPEFQGTKSGLDRVAGCPGFVDAMMQVGWLSLSGTVFTIPHFEYHLSQSAKSRGEDARKKAKSRSVKDKPGTNVPEKGGQKTDIVGTDLGPEERRVEEKRKEDTQTQAAKPRRVFVKPTAAEVSDYAASIGSTIDGREFFDFYESKGWKIGREGMKDWRATVRNWEARRKNERQMKNEQRAERAGFTAQARQDAQWDVFRDFSEAAARDDARDRQRIAASGEGGSTQHRLSDHATLFGEESGTNDAV